MSYLVNKLKKIAQCVHIIALVCFPEIGYDDNLGTHEQSEKDIFSSVTLSSVFKQWELKFIGSLHELS